MKISSKWKDYYDYVAHIYGGGDPSILYLRKRLIEKPINEYAPDCISIVQDGLKRPVDLRFASNPSYSTKWLAVCGRYYLLLLSNDLDAKWEILDEDLHPKVWAWMFDRGYVFGGKKHSWSSHYHPPRNKNYYLGELSKELIQLTKKVGAPVFTFNMCPVNKNDVNVDPVVPVLGDLNFHKFFSPEQLYQEISYFIVNTMKDSPDMMPPTVMSDKEKITQHGFDIKQSFRHRK